MPFGSARDGGVRVHVRVTPRARSAGITGITTDAAGQAWLDVAVTAAPEDGQANDALLRLLARTWRLPRRTMRIARGANDRRKTVFVDGDQVLDSLSGWHRAFRGRQGI